MITLSPRLRLLQDLLLPGEDVWDLCCDHGLLGQAALRSGRHPKVHFVDQVPEIVQRLEKRWGRPDGACYHLADAGLLSEPLRGTVVIAGIGGERTVRIIESLIANGMLRARRLVLCPQKDVDFVEHRMTELTSGLNWSLIESQTVREGHRERRVFVYQRSSDVLFQDP